MASDCGNIKGFFREKKSTAATKSPTKYSNKSPNAAATLGSTAAQPPALVSHGGKPDLQDDKHNEKNEALLRQFDVNMMYGPCIGLTRLERWERAQSLGLNPPPEIQSLLKSGKVKMESMWSGRI
ncbi:unnamed protein product [Sphenostylis stenocarpa]|uniref:DNA polymerase delta subunit 4 n=1 Tax=Sphenostylis stenocarpa TaxID=92480 RepID=A0AA86RYR8_9FABA|nr:unnamed protein product [Sphenostylis stenocarpa]